MRDGWRETTLGEVATFHYGKALRSEERIAGGVPVAGSSGQFGEHDKPNVTTEQSIVVGRKGTAGSVTWFNQPAWVTDTAYWAEPRDGISLRYLRLLLEGADLPSQTAQTGVPGLNRDRAYALPLLSAPLDEQRRIVDLIAAVDDAVEAAEAEAQAARRTLTDIGSVSNERVASGDWATVTLAQALGSGSIMTGPFGSALHQHDYRATGTPVVMPKNISGQRVDYDGIARIGDEDVERLKRYQTRAGDILWSRRGDVTRFAVIGDVDAGSLCGTGCFIVRPEDAKVTPWLEMWMATPLVKQWLTERAVGATMANLNTALLGEVPVADVPEEERDALVSSISSLHAAADAARATADALRTLRSNLLTVLLSGEHEIPASYDALLEEVA